jgi:type III secretion system HrpE/YscL family protein
MDTPNMELHADARFAVTHTGSGGIQVNRAARIMTAETHRSFLHAGEMLDRAQQLADETTALAESGYQQACERGYREGLEQARTRAIHENIQITLQRNKSMESMEGDISALVLQTLRQILGEIDRTERVCMLVREALTRLGQLHGEITLHVHPDLATDVAERISQWHVLQSISLKTISNPTLAPDACRVVCSSGSVAADLQKQMSALELALHKAADVVESTDSAEMHPPKGKLQTC